MGQKTPNMTEFGKMLDQYALRIKEYEQVKSTPSSNMAKRRRKKLKLAKEQLISTYRMTRRVFFESLMHDGHYGDCDYCI